MMDRSVQIRDLLDACRFASNVVLDATFEEVCLQVQIDVDVHRTHCALIYTRVSHLLHSPGNNGCVAVDYHLVGWIAAHFDVTRKTSL